MPTYGRANSNGCRITVSTFILKNWRPGLPIGSGKSCKTEKVEFRRYANVRSAWKLNMADKKKSKSQEQAEGKPAIVQAKDFKAAGGLEQAKKFALKEVEFPKLNK